MKLYGSRVFVKVPEAKRKSKWDCKADIGVLIGYELNGYKILVDGKIIKSRHVEIVEDRESLIGLNEADDNESESEKNFDRNLVNSDVEDNENANAQYEVVEKGNLLNNKEKARHLSVRSNQSEENKPGVRRSEKERKKPERYGKPAETKFVYVNVVSAKNPLTYIEALKGGDCKL